ncbi:hypothetical protein BH11MYX2_BH11MYX2_06240 [soil metagenome]
MKRLTGLVLGVAAVLAGCGDNSKECGTGTADVDGVCTGVGSGSGNANCGDGTMLDEASGTCVIDPTACQNGTVLIGGECVDPTAGLTADVTEAAEPNALGIGGEDSDEPAGQFELKTIGGGPVVVQGNLNPHPSTNEDGSPGPDYDAYIFEVSAPTLLEVTVDGVGGAAGGFAVLPDPADAQLSDWIRFGVNTTGDMAKREVYLPKAGTYIFAVADTRTLVNGDAVGDASNKYFASIEQKAIPTATSVSLTNGAGTSTGTILDGEIKFLSVAAGESILGAQLETYDEDFTGSLLVSSGPNVLGMSDESKDLVADGPAELHVAGPGMQLIVIDSLINTSDAATDYRVSFTATPTVPLRTNNTDAVAINTNPSADLGNGFVYGDYAYYSIDATADDQTVDVDLSFDTDVSGILVDASKINDPFSALVGGLTFLDGNETFTEYKGPIRFPHAGRYYLVVFAPGANAGDEITLTSKTAIETPGVITFGTDLTDVAVGEYNAKTFTYATDAEPWQQFQLSANATSGGATAHFFDAASAYGLLSDIDTTAGGEPADPGVGKLTALTAANNANASRFFIAPVINVNKFIVVVTTGTGNATTSKFSIHTATRDYTDEGTHTAAFSVDRTAETLPATAPVTHRYLLKSAPGNTVTIGADPALLRNVGIHLLGGQENVTTTKNTGLVDVAETLTTTVGASGYLAYEVYDAGAVPGTGNYDYSLDVVVPTLVTPPAPTFTVANGTTQWTNICNMPSAQDITPMPNDRDDSLVGPITLGHSFKFYGTTYTQLQISTNGWLTFDLTETSSPGSPPSTIGASVASVIAPYWTDLTNVRICSVVSGNKLTIQWRGNEYGDANNFGDETIDAFQAILDTSDNSIEFVYAPYLAGSATDAAAGVAADPTNYQQLFNGTSATVAGTSKKLTPITP